MIIEKGQDKNWVNTKKNPLFANLTPLPPLQRPRYPLELVERRRENGSDSVLYLLETRPEETTTD